MRSPVTSERRPWGSLFLWGWRLEIALCGASLVVLGVSEAVAANGPVVVIALALTLLKVRPQILRRLTVGMEDNRHERWLHGAFWHCAIVGRNGDVPRVKRSAPLPVGRRYLVSVPPGLYAEALANRSAELAAALGVREVRVKEFRDSARYVEVAVIWSNPFPQRITSPLLQMPSLSLWNPIYLGVGQDGLPVNVGLPEHNLLIGGEPGSGKSVALSTIVAAAALDPTVHLTLLDGKHVELATWSLIADRFVGSDQEDAAAALEGLRDLMDLRYAMLVAERRRKLSPTDPEGLHVLVIDELAFYLRGGKKETRERFTELLRDLVSRGRAAGIIVVAATQKPSHEIVPTWIRDLFSFRLALRCTSSDASDTILGQGWAHQGFSAATIDPVLRGVGYLLAEGGTPTLLMTPYLSDEDMDALAHRSFELRRMS
ncbi:MAG: FtsK/SpoIIIE domain-containing protein [Acidimicrobiales bacterium]